MAKGGDFRTLAGAAAVDWLRQDGGDVLLLVHLQPGARRSAIAGEFNGRLKIAIAAPPLEGRANQALCRWLAERLGLPQRRVRIDSGEHSRDKLLRIGGTDVDVIRDRLAPAKQAGRQGIDSP